jgi:uncharacterized protein YecT (DUF1311 family)
MKIISIITALALSTGLILAEEQDPIDQAMEAAMEKDPSTAGMVGAINDALAKWEEKLDSSYKALEKKLPANEWKELVEAQKAWISFKDLQLKALASSYDRMEGTMWVPIHAERAMGLTRQRAQFLAVMLDHFGSDGTE